MPNEIIIRGMIHDTGARRGNRALRGVLTLIGKFPERNYEIWREYNSQFAILSRELEEAGLDWAMQTEREEGKPCRYERIWEVQMEESLTQLRSRARSITESPAVAESLTQLRSRARSITETLNQAMTRTDSLIFPIGDHAHISANDHTDPWIEPGGGVGD